MVGKIHEAIKFCYWRRQQVALGDFVAEGVAFNTFTVDMLVESFKQSVIESWVVDKLQCGKFSKGLVFAPS